MTDLLVSVAGDQIVLRSARLGRRVVPRLTSAHNFTMSQGIYRFLCACRRRGRRGSRLGLGAAPRRAVSAPGRDRPAGAVAGRAGGCARTS